MRFVILSLLLVGLVGCDQPTQNATTTKPEGEIVWIGNGARPTLNLANMNSVVADFGSESVGKESLKVGELGVEPLVIDEEKNEVSVYLGWVAPGEKDEPVIELEINVEEQQECKHFETLQNGQLVCRADLEGLSVSPEHAPFFLRTGGVVYINRSQELRVFVNTQTHLIHENVDAFFVDNDFMLAFRGAQTQTWSLLSLASPELLSEIPSFESRFVFLGEDKKIYTVLESESADSFASLVRLDSLFSSTKVIDFPAELKLVDVVEKQDTDAEGLVVNAFLGEQPKLIRVNSSGYESIELPVDESQPEALEAEDEPQQETQEEEQIVESYFLVRNEGAELKFCVESKQESSESKCYQVPRPEDFKLTQAVLGPESAIYVAGYYDQQPEPEADSGIEEADLAPESRLYAIQIHGLVKTELENFVELKSEQLYDRPVERLRYIKPIKTDSPPKPLPPEVQ